LKSLKLAILISGRGSNMLALADYAIQNDVPCDIVAVIADRPATGLALADDRGLPVHEIPSFDYADKAAHEEVVCGVIDQSGADVIFLAGYMRLLSAGFCSRYRDRLFNIHPSLLPRYKGLDTHTRVLAAGEQNHGCSVHLATAEMDDGPVLAQREVPVMADDTAEALAERVLAQEHHLYPAVLGALASGLLKVKDGKFKCEAGILPGLIGGQKQRWPYKSN
jgi:formyltetrahydrofolate-dependent phosphoribosylglycinamide formyltransferase